MCSQKKSTDYNDLSGYTHIQFTPYHLQTDYPPSPNTSLTI